MRRSAIVWLTLAMGCASAASSARDGAGPNGTDPQATATAGSTSEGTGEASAAGVTAPLTVVAVVPQDARFVPIDGKTFVVAAGPTLLEIDGRRVVHDGRKAAGMEKPFDDYGAGEIVTLMGRWPGEAWLALNLPQVVAGSYLYRWGGERWEKEGTSKWRAIDSSGWKDGRSLVLLEKEDGSQTRLSDVPHSGVEVPSFTDKSDACRLVGRRVTAFGSGEIVVQGDLCDGGVGSVIGFWKSGAASGVVHDMPRIEGRGFGISAMVARSPKEIYLVGWSGPDPDHPHAAYLARFDGNDVVLEKAPTHLPLSDVAAGDGTLYVIEAPLDGARVLWLRDRSGAWSKVAMPQHDGAAVEPRRLWLRGPGDVWVLGAAGRRGVVLHSGPAAAMTVHERTSVSEYQSLGPATERCNPLLVILGKKSAVDEAAVRQALAEVGGRQILVEFHRRGDTLLGAVAYTLPMAQGIEKAMKEKVPSASPETLCHEPRNKHRQLVLDPKTKRWQVHQL